MRDEVCIFIFGKNAGSILAYLFRVCWTCVAAGSMRFSVRGFVLRTFLFSVSWDLCKNAGTTALKFVGTCVSINSQWCQWEKNTHLTLWLLDNNVPAAELGSAGCGRERKQKSERICIEKRSHRNRPPQIIHGVPAPVVADRAVRAGLLSGRWYHWNRYISHSIWSGACDSFL